MKSQVKLSASETTLILTKLSNDYLVSTDTELDSDLAKRQWR